MAHDVRSASLVYRSSVVSLPASLIARVTPIALKCHRVPEEMNFSRCYTPGLHGTNTKGSHVDIHLDARSTVDDKLLQKLPDSFLLFGDRIE